MNCRGCGILLHISSLPNKYGIGTFGKEAYQFVSFLKESRQKYWQVLPLGQTTFGDSPYQTFSSYALNPYFIDYDILQQKGLLKLSDYKHLKTEDSNIDYGTLYNTKYAVLKKAFQKFDVQNEGFQKFIDEQKHWLDDYAKFMVIKNNHYGASFNAWDNDYKYRNPDALNSLNQDEIMYWKFIQYEAFCEWFDLKKFANENDIKIIGDIPIYVAYDSVDVWSNPKNWKLDENLLPSVVAGVPPDAFSEDGQLWGNPIYRYDVMEQDNFSWWVARISHSLKLFDIVRIDHFRGFESYFEIPSYEQTAKNGYWVKGPDIKLFNSLKEQLGEINVIAEDLGFLTDAVYQLLNETKYPGMKVLQFAFYENSDSLYLPHNHIKNSVVYTGTHDNMTTKEWFNSLPEKDKKYCMEYLGFAKEQQACMQIIKSALSSVADYAIIPIQDYLELEKEARLNTPGKSQGNWQWRLKPRMLTDKLAKKMAELAKMYGR